MRPIRSVFTLTLACAISSSVSAQGVHNNHLLRYSEAHGMTFSEIGDPGNDWHGATVPGIGFDLINGVDYRYRISRTEVTKAQYFRFVEAVAPHIDALGGGAQSLAGSGTLIYLGRVDGIPRYQLEAGTGNEPAMNTIRYFALMANWLHNGAPVTGEATIADFQSGAYDDWTNPVRSDSAEFWIPSRDEWAKAGYWDPNRHGQGQGGWWQYPDASNDPLIPGDPALGGETSAGNGLEWPTGQFKPKDVGSYPDTQSPWGLLDVSGSEREWTDTQYAPGVYYADSTSRGDTDESGMIIFDHGDRLASDALHTPLFVNESITPRPYTVRFAAAIPSPGVPGVIAFGALLAARRKR